MKVNAPLPFPLKKKQTNKAHSQLKWSTNASLVHNYGSQDPAGTDLANCPRSKCYAHCCHYYFISHSRDRTPVTTNVACIAGLPVRGEQKAAAGEGEGKVPSPPPLPRCSFLLARNGNACNAGYNKYDTEYGKCIEESIFSVKWVRIWVRLFKLSWGERGSLFVCLFVCLFVAVLFARPYSLPEVTSRLWLEFDCLIFRKTLVTHSNRNRPPASLWNRFLTGRTGVAEAPSAGPTVVLLLFVAEHVLTRLTWLEGKQSPVKLCRLLLGHQTCQVGSRAQYGESSLATNNSFNTNFWLGPITIVSHSL